MPIAKFEAPAYISKNINELILLFDTISQKAIFIPKFQTSNQSNYKKNALFTQN